LNNSKSDYTNPFTVILVVLFAGYAVYLVFLFCCLGDPGRSPITVTEIPGGTTEVLLHGPNTKGSYACIVMYRGTWTPRELGPLQPNQTTPATLEDLGSGVFRVRWGSAQPGPYVMIDTEKDLIIEDSNPSNPRNQAIKKPRR
jgi:hypothetical protein